MRLADFVIKFLEEKKIDTVFTVSGGGQYFYVMPYTNLKN
jgi:thiamine pyrophosphate-dependent acetolactate synthase large subunit-like protein